MHAVSKAQSFPQPGINEALFDLPAGDPLVRILQVGGEDLWMNFVGVRGVDGVLDHLRQADGIDEALLFLHRRAHPAAHGLPQTRPQTWPA